MEARNVGTKREKNHKTKLYKALDGRESPYPYIRLTKLTYSIIYGIRGLSRACIN